MTNEQHRRPSRTGRNRLVAAIALACAAVLFTADFADARAGRGSGFGSRGARTFQAPPATQTAPRPAAPIERSVTPNNPSAAQRAPGAGAAAAARPGGFFNRGGFIGGLFAGFLGAGLFGLLFGGGLFSGLGSFASILGLLLQVALVVIVARLLINWYRRRSQPQTAMAGHAPQPDMDVRQQPMQRSILGGLGGGASAPVHLAQSDFDNFEKTLVDVQEAYGREDLSKLRTLVTPEMLSFMAEDLADNSSRGVVNEISGVKLEQGDLAESWREERTEYATVAMRYTITDVMRERVSGHVVEGDPAESEEVTEVWTFRRAPGAGWVVSAIQQA